MDRSPEPRIWHRSAAAGFLVLALSAGGSFAFADAPAAPSCSVREAKSGSEWVLEHVAPHVIAAPLVTKIARAAIAYALGSCA